MHWIIDPIKSFSPDEIGCRDQQLIQMSDGKPLNDEVLWRAGKEAFDIIQRGENAKVTQADLDELVQDTPGQLIELWNWHAEFFEQKAQSGGMIIINKDSGQPMTKFERLTVKPDGFWAPFHIEGSIITLDCFFESYSLQSGKEMFPYNRDLLAAYFTILHVDTSAADIALKDFTPETYFYVTRWLDRLKTYDEIMKAVEHRQESLQREKSRTMNTQRHAKRNEALLLVTADWSERKTDFRSAEKAGQYYADWLSGKGFEFEPRTITSWIRKFAKENNIILR